MKKYLDIIKPVLGIFCFMFTFIILADKIIGEDIAHMLGSPVFYVSLLITSFLIYYFNKKKANEEK